MLNKLPKWAQEYIRNIERDRELSVRALNEFVDTQTESPIWVDEGVCTGEESGPAFKRHYIQAYQVTFRVGTQEVYIGLDLRDSSELKINCGGRTMVFQPIASNAMKILDR
jgi:hypothetical protein